MLTRLTLYIAYSIKTSEWHHYSKTFFYDLLKNPKSKSKPYFDIFMITLVMSSVFILIHEVKNENNIWSVYFENIVISIFLCEYLLRGWVYSDIHQIIIQHHEHTKYLGQPFSLAKVAQQIFKNKLGYIFSPSALIDLLAILPSYRPLRLLRIFLIFRLFKLLRYSQSIQMFTGILKSKQFELTTLTIFMGFLVFIASTAFYIFENQSTGGQVDTLYDAFYWAVVTISTVGYGDIIPRSTGGRLVTSALIISGLGVLAFFTSIIVAAFNEKMSEFQQARVKENIKRSEDSIILCGFGRVGQQIAQQLSDNKKSFIVIDLNKQHSDLATQKGYLALNEDASKNSTLLHAGINRAATTVLCVTGDDVINVYITLTSRHLNANINIISRANRDDNVKKLYQAGASQIPPAKPEA
jgi:voltage-gated potassium channel